MRYRNVGSRPCDKAVVIRRRRELGFSFKSLFLNAVLASFEGDQIQKKRAPKRPSGTHCRRTSVHADVGVLAVAAGLAVAPVGEELELAFLAGHAVDVGPAPGIRGHGFLEIRALPGLGGLRLSHQRLEAFLRARIAPHVEAVLVERFLERLDLRPRDLDLGPAHLGEVARGHVPGEQADDHDHHEELEQRETGWLAVHGGSYRSAAPSELLVAGVAPLMPKRMAGRPVSAAPTSGPLPVKLSLKFGSLTPRS